MADDAKGVDIVAILCRWTRFQYSDGACVKTGGNSIEEPSTWALLLCALFLNAFCAPNIRKYLISKSHLCRKPRVDNMFSLWIIKANLIICLLRFQKTVIDGVDHTKHIQRIPIKVTPWLVLLFEIQLGKKNKNRMVEKIIFKI